MSALARPPKADIACRACHVRFVPKADERHRSKKALFDHLVGGGDASIPSLTRFQLVPHVGDLIAQKVYHALISDRHSKLVCLFLEPIKSLD
jgi:hypothetical protein